MGLTNIPFIFITAVAESERILDIFKIGATDYFIKPFVKEKLIAKLKVHIQNLKFTHHNGKITVSTQKKGELLEAIRDTGVGIEPKNLEKIFKIDSKFSKPGTDKETGTGLGLILCKEFVEKQGGGTIWVISEINQGSTFTFTLPLAK